MTSVASPTSRRRRLSSPKTSVSVGVQFTGLSDEVAGSGLVTATSSYLFDTTSSGFMYNFYSATGINVTASSVASSSVGIYTIPELAHSCSIVDSAGLALSFTLDPSHKYLDIQLEGTTSGWVRPTWERTAS